MSKIASVVLLIALAACSEKEPPIDVAALDAAKAHRSAQYLDFLSTWGLEHAARCKSTPVFAAYTMLEVTLACMEISAGAPLKYTFQYRPRFMNVPAYWTCRTYKNDEPDAQCALLEKVVK